MDGNEETISDTKKWVQFTCDVNYQLDGDQWIQCVDGVWSGNLPKCIGKPKILGVPIRLLS